MAPETERPQAIDVANWQLRTQNRDENIECQALNFAIWVPGDRKDSVSGQKTADQADSNGSDLAIHLKYDAEKQPLRALYLNETTRGNQLGQRFVENMVIVGPKFDLPVSGRVTKVNV